jgi:hypothetical protein
MSNEASVSEDIGIVLSCLAAAGDAERLAQYQLWADTPACRDAVAAIQSGKCEDFHLRLIYPFEQLVEGLLRSALPGRGRGRARFLLIHYDFFRAHFRRIIESYDGFACCADKTRTILTRLLAFHISGRRIAFNASEKYTFHHPKNVFTTHEAIVEFFESLYQLYAGSPAPYLAALKNIACSATGTDGGADTPLK